MVMSAGEIGGDGRPVPDSVVLLGRGGLVGWPQEELDRLVAAVRATGRYRMVEGALLDVGTPHLPKVLRVCIDAGARRILVVPVYLPIDRRLQEWLAKVVRRWLKKHHVEDVEVVLADPLGDQPALAEAVVRVVAAAEGGEDVRASAPLRDRADQWVDIPRPLYHAFFCVGPRCAMLGAPELYQQLRERLRERGLWWGYEGGTAVTTAPTGCLHPCDLGPIMVVYPDGTWYGALNERAIERIVDEHFVGGRPVEAHLRPRPRRPHVANAT